MDYQTGDNAYLTNGVINNGDGSITVPAGVRSFEAHVPVIDDNIIEKTEVASIQIGSTEGIAQIFDNDSLPSLPKPGLGVDPTSQQPLTAQSVPVASITANSVTEGDGNNLLFNVELDQSSPSDLSLKFKISGDAKGAPSNIPNKVDYLNQDNVKLTNGVINNGDGLITIPAGVQSFTASVPVVDDTIIEDTEQAIFSIGSYSGIGQILDNDGSETSTKPTLEVDENNLGITFKGAKDSELWIKLRVLEGRDQWQNNLVLTNTQGRPLGSLGSTPQTHRHP